MPDQAKKVRVGLAGLGLAATPHWKGYSTHPEAEVLAVCDKDGQRAKSFAEEHGVRAYYDSFEALLGDSSINTVDIATPTHLHARMARRAAEAGKHVHCEKPFCCSVAEGEKACSVAAAQGVSLAVGETYVFLSSHRKARELIEAGEIGRPVQVRQRHGGWLERAKPAIPTGPRDRSWRVDPARSGGGNYPWLFDHAVHFFATAEYFALDEPVMEIYAQAGGKAESKSRSGAAHDPYRGTEPDIPLIVWKHGDGSAQGLWARAERLNNSYDYMRGFSTTAVGESGMIEVLGEGGGNLFWNGEPQHLVLHRAGKETVCFRFDEGGDDVWQSEICYYSQGHINQIHHFVDSIISGGDPRYTGEDGIRAVRCTLAAIASAEEKRPVRVDEIGRDITAASL